MRCGCSLGRLKQRGWICMSSVGVLTLYPLASLGRRVSRGTTRRRSNGRNISLNTRPAVSWMPPRPPGEFTAPLTPG